MQRLIEELLARADADVQAVFVKIRVLWSGFRHDISCWRRRDRQAEGYSPAFDPSLPTGRTVYLPPPVFKQGGEH